MSMSREISRQKALGQANGERMGLALAQGAGIVQGSLKEVLNFF